MDIDDWQDSLRKLQETAKTIIEEWEPTPNTNINDYYIDIISTPQQS